MTRAPLMVVDDEVAHMRALCDTLGIEGYASSLSRLRHAAARGAVKCDSQLPLRIFQHPPTRGAQPPAAAVDPKFNIDIADWNGVVLRRRLNSADFFKDCAMRRALRCVNTPGSRSSASLR